MLVKFQFLVNHLKLMLNNCHWKLIKSIICRFLFIFSLTLFSCASLHTSSIWDSLELITIMALVIQPLLMINAMSLLIEVSILNVIIIFQKKYCLNFVKLFANKSSSKSKNSCIYGKEKQWKKWCKAFVS